MPQMDETFVVYKILVKKVHTSDVSPLIIVHGPNLRKVQMNAAPRDPKYQKHSPCTAGARFMKGGGAT